MASHELDIALLRSTPVAVATMLTCAGLMVSRVPFPSYKRFKKRAHKFGFFGSVAGGLTLLATGGPGGTVLLGVLALYVVAGLISRLTGP